MLELASIWCLLWNVTVGKVGNRKDIRVIDRRVSRHVPRWNRGPCREIYPEPGEKRAQLPDNRPWLFSGVFEFVLEDKRAYLRWLWGCAGPFGQVVQVCSHVHRGTRPATFHWHGIDLLGQPLQQQPSGPRRTPNYHLCWRRGHVSDTYRDSSTIQGSHHVLTIFTTPHATWLINCDLRFILPENTKDVKVFILLDNIITLYPTGHEQS